MAKCHDRCLLESYCYRCAPASIRCDRVGFLPPLRSNYLAMNDIFNGGGVEDFFHRAVPGGARCAGCRRGECRIAEGTACAVPRKIEPPVEAYSSTQRAGES